MVSATPLFAWWRFVGARFVAVANAGTDGEAVVLDDVAGAFDDWRRAHAGADVIVLRPDRYVAAACARSDFAAVTDALRATFGCPSGGE